MIGAYVAAVVVTLVQFLRARDRRLLLLAALFACQAQALSREWTDVWKDVYQALSCAFGLALLGVLSYRPHANHALHRGVVARAASPAPRGEGRLEPPPDGPPPAER